MKKAKPNDAEAADFRAAIEGAEFGASARPAANLIAKPNSTHASVPAADVHIAHELMETSADREAIAAARAAAAAAEEAAAAETRRRPKKSSLLQPQPKLQLKRQLPKPRSRLIRWQCEWCR